MNKLKIKDLLFFLILILVVSLYVFFILNESATIEDRIISISPEDKGITAFASQKNSYGNVGAISQGTVISHSVFPKRNSLSSIGIFIQTYRQRVTGNVLMILKENGKVLREVKIDAHSARDNNMLNFDFNPIKDSKGKEYEINIVFNISPQQKVTVTGLSGGDVEKGKLLGPSWDKNQLDLSLGYRIKFRSFLGSISTLFQILIVANIIVSAVLIKVALNNVASRMSFLKF